ncbi:MAG: LysE family translocator [Acidobacteria bacterium]|nr:LysE family translocator [Acidobacteriota bacterium]
MLDTHNLIVFLLATVTLNLTPGPDILYIIARSVGQGRAAGIVSSLGIATGLLVHTLAVAFGLASLLMAAPAVYDAIRYAGAAYLIYLGLRVLLSHQKRQPETTLEPMSLSAIFLQGMLTNVLNPKIALFFLAFLPQFTNRMSGNVAVQVILLGLFFILLGSTINLAVALAASSIGTRFKTYTSGSTAFRWLTGGLFIGLGLRLALLERR